MVTTKRTQLTARERADMKKSVSHLYADSKLSIREIASLMECSYGFIHRLLSENGTVLRPRGGNMRSRKR